MMVASAHLGPSIDDRLNLAFIEIAGHT